MKIRRAEKKDIAEIARIHHCQINRGLLYSLGEKFLRLMYSNISENPDSIIYVADDMGNIIGYVSGTRNKKSLYKKFYINYSLRIMPILAYKSIVNPSIFFRLLKQALSNEETMQSELLSIAVTEKRKGIGKMLADKLVDWYKQQKINEFCVTVDKKTEHANNFYKKYGFSYKKTYKIGKEEYNEYVYKI